MVYNLSELKKVFYSTFYHVSTNNLLTKLNFSNNVQTNDDKLRASYLTHMFRNLFLKPNHKQALHFELNLFCINLTNIHVRRFFNW